MNSLSIDLFAFPGALEFLYALFFASAILIFGSFMSRIAFPESPTREKILLGYPAFVVLVLILFLIDFLMSGTIFSHGFVIISIFTILFAVLSFLNRSIFSRSILREITIVRFEWGLFLLFVVVVYSLPITLSPSGIVWRGGDMRWHITWVNQILLGKRIPSVMYANVPNSYPWLFHALLAFMHPFFCVFGFDHVQSIFLAYDVVGIITIIWGFVAMYSLGAVLFDGKKTEKALSTFLGIFSGGIGFLVVREPFVIITESAFEKYFSFTLGDMIITWPYNASLVFVVPSWPRHLCYVVYLTLIYSLVRLWSSYETKDRREWMIVSGVVLGLTGLIHSTFMMISALVIIFLFLWSLMKEEKRCDLLLTILVAGVVFLPWAGPYLLNSLKFGTTSTTLMSPLDLPPHLIITALGQVSLFSPIGLFFLAKHHMNNGISAKWAVIHLYAVCLAGAVFLANLLPSDLSVLGFLLSRQHRYWFTLYPFLALYATKGLSRIYEKISKLPYHVPIRTFLTAVIIFLGIGSPILTSIGVAQTLSDNAINREFRVSRPDQLMTAIWENLTKDAVVATPPSEEWLARYISCFTGAYVVYVDRPKIRWTELEIPSHGERYADLVVLYSKKSSAQDKLDVVRKYGITHIVSGGSIDSSLHHLVSEVHLTTFSNQTFYVYCLEPA